VRLLYVTADPGVPVLGHKGASVHVRELVEALAAAGTSVTIASPRIRYDGERIAADVELVAINPVLPKDYATRTALRRAVREQAIQVSELARTRGIQAIYERFSLFSNAGARAAAGLGIPHALEVNAPLRDEARRFRTLPHPEEAAAIESVVLASTDHVFAVSEELRGVLVDDGVEPEKVEVLPNAVDPLKFPLRHSPSGRGFTVGFCGSLKPWHGVELLLEGVRLALVEEPALRLEIVGAGPGDELLANSDPPGLSLVRHGALTHRAALETMACWDVGVAPFLPVPRFYFSPLKVLEYMASGLCVLASDLGQIRGLLGNGERGVLVPAGNVDALAGALVALARDPGRTAALGARGRSHVLSSFTWAGNAKRVLRALMARPTELVA
jgi:glycosyltransferase involved in cell wall biosynthesis